MIPIDEFHYPLPGDEASRIIEEHDAEWRKYWLETNRKGVRPKENPLYKQAIVEQTYGNAPVERGPYTELEFINAIKAETITAKDKDDLTPEFIWDYLQTKAEKLAVQVNQVWASYGSLLLDRSFGQAFFHGYYYNYFKAIACGKDPKTAYYYAVARAMDGVL